MKRMGLGEAGSPGAGGMFQGMPGMPGLSRMYGGGWVPAKYTIDADTSLDHPIRLHHR